MKPETLPHVVIVGAGFGGLETAQKLAHAPVRITLLDRHNYHLFQPLLYQIAIAGLVPSQIAYPLRTIFLKDLFELLEKIFDRCRDAGNSVFQIVLKHS